MRKLTKVLPILIVMALVAAVATSAFAAPPKQEEADIVDTAVAAGSFNTLVTAVQAAGLVDTLKGEGPFTVFAPTDDAFAALPAGTLDSLLADPTALAKILTYHVVPGKVMAADVVTLTSADTVEGSPISIAVVDGQVILNDSATVVTTDIETSNGVIHVIDAVLLPPAEGEMMDDKSMMEEPMAEMDIVDTAIAAGSFNTLVTAVQAAGLVDTLKSDGPFTVFAPTDDAFAALPEGTLDSLLADPAALGDILLYHVVPGTVMAADVVNLTSADSAQGSPIAIEVVDGQVVLNGNATVVTTDIETSNGVIHVIDAVILPPAEGETMEDSAMMGEDVAACESYTLQADDWLSKVSDKFLGDVLAYNVIVDATNAAAAESSKYVVIEDANIVEAGQVVCIPAEGAMMDDKSMMEEPMAEMDIVDTAVAAGSFNTLVTAVQAAGLVDTLKSEGPFTVFAPTDDAFAALPEGTLDALLADPAALGDILLYHVVPGKVMAADVVNLTSADSAQGSPIAISIVDGKVMLNDSATVITTDIETSNGVIHVIDAVILPPSN